MINNGLPAIHPGVFLSEILEEREVSQAILRAPSCRADAYSHVIKARGRSRPSWRCCSGRHLVNRRIIGSICSQPMI